MGDRTQLRRAAMDLLARREHSARELTDKLLRRQVSRAEVQAVIEQLAEEGLQSDARFAESYVRSRAARSFGPRRILLELVQRGVTRELASITVDAADIDWVEARQAALTRRFGDAQPVDSRERFKRLRWLQERGFDVSGAGAVELAPD